MTPWPAPAETRRRCSCTSSATVTRRARTSISSPADTPGPDRIDSENAVPLGQRIKELLRQYPGVDGLMLVIDACHSGAVISDPVPGLLRQGLQARVEFFAATRPEDVASNGCFSRSLIELLKKGSPRTADAQLRAYDEHDRLREVAPARLRGPCADDTHVVERQP